MFIVIDVAADISLPMRVETATAGFTVIDLKNCERLLVVNPTMMLMSVNLWMREDMRVFTLTVIETALDLMASQSRAEARLIVTVTEVEAESSRWVRVDREVVTVIMDSRVADRSWEVATETETVKVEATLITLPIMEDIVIDAVMALSLIASHILAVVRPTVTVTCVAALMARWMVF